jgi:hypothetical protein
MTALAAAGAVMLLPLSMQQSLIGTNDAVALMFAMGAAYCIFSDPARPVLAGISAAAVIATKVPMTVWLIPVFVSGAVRLYQREGGYRLGEAVVRCGCAGAVGIILFDPYLWLEPVRAVKGTIGAVLAHTNGAVPEVFVLTVGIAGPIAVLFLAALSAVGIVAAWQNRSLRLPALALGSLLIALFAFFLKSGFDYWRYMLGALVPGTALWAFASASRWRDASALALFAVTFALGAIELGQQIALRRPEVAQPFTVSVEAMCRRGETIWMHDQILAMRYHQLPMPKATLAEIASYFENADRSRAIGDWLAAAKVNPAAAVALQTDFDEEDQVHLARWRAMAVILDSPLNCPFHFFRYDFGETETNIPSGYVRGTFTDKSLRDVEANLESLGVARVINVIGPDTALAQLHMPMQPIGNGMSVVTKRGMTE